MLLVAGADDQLISPDKTFSVEQGLVTSETLSNVGHMSMYEGTNKLVGIIREFLNPSR